MTGNQFFALIKRKGLRSTLFCRGSDVLLVVIGFSLVMVGFTAEDGAGTVELFTEDETHHLM
jgi:hypothetical protein